MVARLVTSRLLRRPLPFLSSVLFEHEDKYHLKSENVFPSLTRSLRFPHAIESVRLFSHLPLMPPRNRFNIFGRGMTASNVGRDQVNVSQLIDQVHVNSAGAQK
jgi:hypothetical protein